jgi:hypothetical protein
MSAETFLYWSRLLMVIGGCTTLIVWLGYTALAPWYKYSSGRYIWGLLTAILALLVITIMRFIIPGYPFRFQLVIAGLILFDIAIIGMGFGIYNAQVLRYYKAKFASQERAKKNDQKRSTMTGDH